MSSQRRSSKGRSAAIMPSPGVDDLAQNVSDTTLDSSRDGEWEMVTKKNKNRAGSNAAKQWVPNNATPKAWGQPDTAQRLGIWNNNGSRKGPMSGPYGQNSRAGGQGWRSQPASQNISQSLEHGWNGAGRAGGSSQLKTVDDEPKESTDTPLDDEDDDDDTDVYSDDDDDIPSDGYGSDESAKSFETRKKHKMLKIFFEQMDNLSAAVITDPVRQWHCPACQNGPGAIDWYKGLQPLANHARTKGSKRVKLHREFAELLEEELRRRGTSFIPSGGSFGQWEGLVKEARDHQIVWPPMVMVVNTRCDKDENDKWLGMGNQELLDYFRSYAVTKAGQSYGPQGHRGISILIFESSAVGYLEADRLHRHFLEQGTGREAWERTHKLFLHGGRRQLYGFLATKEDLDFFNQHSQGKSRLKFELKSYQEMVVSQLKQMSEENEQLTWFKNDVTKEQRRSKMLEESLNIASQQLRKATEQKGIVLQRTKIQHEQIKEEMDFQEKFFSDQLRQIQVALCAKEQNFEKIQQDERQKMELSGACASSADNCRQRADEVAKFIKSQDKEREHFIAKRDKISKIYEDKKAAMKKQHWEEELELEKEFDSAMTQLMETYAPGSTSVDASFND